MQLHPIRPAVDVAAIGVCVVAAGVAFGQVPMLAWGGALLMGIAIARAVTLASVSRIRAAGFEMLWKESTRMRRVGRGQSLELTAEVRNRDSRAARYVELRAVCSPQLSVDITPSFGEVSAGGRLRVTIVVHAPRVGDHGIFGLSLEVRGSPGLFEIPLTFSNPFGIEVLPSPFGAALRSARGGRSRTLADAGRPGPLSGDGQELREIREHQPGDPFKRIAWKASARRGKLLMRDYEREERDVVWLLLDASVELWAGAAGTAPLDLAIDELAAVAQAHLGRGDRVGLAVCAARLLAWVPPTRGPAQSARIARALAIATGTLDSDRSDLDEMDVAARVLEHLRPLAPDEAAGTSLRDLDRLASRSRRIVARAPFAAREVVAPTTRERQLRSYLARFGMDSPPRLEPDRPKTDAIIAAALTKALSERPKASLLFLWSPAPDPANRPLMAEALRARPRRGVELRWVRMRYEPSIPHEGRLGRAIADAVAMRTTIAESHGERVLRQLGVRVERIRPRHIPRTVAAPEPEEPSRELGV